MSFTYIGGFELASENPNELISKWLIKQIPAPASAKAGVLVSLVVRLV